MDRQITSEQVRFYHEQGYVVLEGLFSPAECDAMLAICQRLGGQAFKAVLNADRQVPALRRVMADPRVVRILETLQGAEVVGLMSQVMYKQVGTPYASMGWNPHQDNAYPQAPDGAYITINIFLHDSDPDNGGLYIYPGSHREGTLPFEPVKSYQAGANSGNAVAVPTHYQTVDLRIPRGGTLVLNSNVIHGSYPNRSATRSRTLFSCCYITKGAPFLPGQTAKREVIPLR